MKHPKEYASIEEAWTDVLDELFKIEGLPDEDITMVSMGFVAGGIAALCFAREGRSEEALRDLSAWMERLAAKAGMKTG